MLIGAGILVASGIALIVGWRHASRIRNSDLGRAVLAVGVLFALAGGALLTGRISVVILIVAACASVYSWLFAGCLLGWRRDLVRGASLAVVAGMTVAIPAWQWREFVVERSFAAFVNQVLVSEGAIGDYLQSALFPMVLVALLSIAASSTLRTCRGPTGGRSRNLRVAASVGLLMVACNYQLAGTWNLPRVAEQGRARMLTYILVSRPGCVRARTWTEGTLSHPIEHACKYGNNASVLVQMVRLGARTFDLQVCSELHDECISVLCHAILTKSYDPVATLLQYGSDPNDPDGHGSYPLHYAIETGSAAVTRLLLDRGAHVDARNAGKYTALHLAAFRGDLVLLQLLIERGASIEAKCEMGMTPLLIAVMQGHAPLVRFLLELGASIKATDDSGRSPLHLVIGDDVVLAEFLVASGADVNAVDSGGQTPLDISHAGRHSLLSKLLVANGAKANYDYE